jgi:hypothetical protein
MRQVGFRALICALAVAAIAGPAGSTEIPLDQRRSGYADLGRDTKAMQDG